MPESDIVAGVLLTFALAILSQASQDFDPRSRAVINRADVFGKNLFVTADGSYEPQVGIAELLMF